MTQSDSVKETVWRKQLALALYREIFWIRQKPREDVIEEFEEIIEAIVKMAREAKPLRFPPRKRKP